jgi:predicted secreted hydrolase
MRHAISSLLAIVLSITVLLPAPSRAADDIPAAKALGDGNSEGYARATAPRPFTFPQDHGPHPEFRTEWWYFTGNLDDPEGRPFGYQLTFFRIGLSPKSAPSGSPWRTNQLYMAHFALSDIAGKQFHAFERFNRGAMGLAWAKTDTLHVWLDNWSVEPETRDVFPLRLRAQHGAIAIDLALEQGKPVVLQGVDGLSQKSAEPGNASYYYSLTRMPTTGVITVGDQRFEVQGASWLDREWSTSALGKDQVGWDWFALQLSDRREIMFYRLRRRDGGTDPMSAGTLVALDGGVRRLNHGDVEIEALSYWQSPKSGARYPAKTRLRIPKEDLALEIEPLLSGQELNVSVRYWEGAVTIRGTARGTPINGQGYMELTGYAGEVRK